MKSEDVTAFKRICAEMIESGHGDEVRAFGKELLTEAIRRKLPLSPDLQRLRKAMAMNKIEAYRHLYRAAIRLMSGAGLEAHDFPCGCCVCEMAAALAMIDMDDTMMQPEQALVDNLAMLAKRMAHRLSKHKEHIEDAKLAEQALEFLRVNALLGSVLR